MCTVEKKKQKNNLDLFDGILAFSVRWNSCSLLCCCILTKENKHRSPLQDQNKLIWPRLALSGTQMGLGPAAACAALSCHVSLMWLINLPSSVSSVGQPVAWKCNLLVCMPTNTPAVEPDVMNGQALCSPLSPLCLRCDLSRHPMCGFQVISVPPPSPELPSSCRRHLADLQRFPSFRRASPFQPAARGILAALSFSAIDRLGSLFTIHSERREPRSRCQQKIKDRVCAEDRRCPGCLGNSLVPALYVPLQHLVLAVSR